MKILTLISGGDVGGAKTHVLSLLKRMNNTITAQMVCFKEGDFADDARKMGIPTTVLASGNILKDYAALREMLENGQYDIIHSHGSRGNFMASMLKKHTGLPTVTTVHSDYRHDYMGRPLGAITYGTLNKYALRRLDYLIGVSDTTSGLLIRRGFEPDKVFTIYNGIDLRRSARICPREDFFRSYGLDFTSGNIIIGIAARLNPVKDIATLIRGFALALESDCRLRLLIAGDGPEDSNLKKLAEELGIFSKTAFLGWVPETEMDSFYAALDINALSSLTETFAYALTEGVRFKLPTISSRVGGVTYLIDNGVNGLLFEPGDHITLAKYITLLARDENMRKRFGEKLYEKTDRHFSLDVTCDTQLRIYEAILRRTGKKTEKHNGIAICGAYGMGNSGDEAILEAILNEIRDLDPDLPVFVLSKTPKITRSTNFVHSHHTFNIPSFFKISSKIKLYINGGGSLIQDHTSRASLWFYLYTIYVAKKRGAKVIMYGCGIGPVNYPSDRRLAARIINKYVDVITLREDSSVHELKDMGITAPEIHLAADPAIALEAASSDTIDSEMLSNSLLPNGKYICFMVRRWQGFDNKILSFAAAADYAYSQHGLTPVFFPIDNKKDLDPSLQIAKHMKSPYVVMPGTSPPAVIIGIMSRMTAVVSMRLHGLIFAAGHGVPLVGIVYDPKVASFLRYIDQHNFMELSEVSTGTLIPAIEQAIIQGNSETQVNAVAKLWEMEKVNRNELRKLLEMPDEL